MGVITKTTTFGKITIHVDGQYNGRWFLDDEMQGTFHSDKDHSIGSILGWEDVSTKNKVHYNQRGAYAKCPRLVQYLPYCDDFSFSDDREIHVRASVAWSDVESFILLKIKHIINI